MRPSSSTKALPLIAVLAFLLPGAVPASADSPAQLEADGVTGLIVQRAPGLTAAEREDVRDDAGVELVASLPLPDTELVRADEGGLTEALADLRADPDVAHAEVDAPVRAFITPGTDPLWGQLWALENTGQYKGTPGADIDIRAAWAVTRGAGETIAVVDTGVRADHQDLAGRLNLQGAWDFVDDDRDPQDGAGHGTHVTGVVAATRGNGLGVAGVAPEATVLPMRVMSSGGEGQLSDVLQAFDRAGRLGIRVVNASFGTTTSSRLLQETIAAYPGTLFVAAAGNDGWNVDARPTYPCALTLPNVICVGASGTTDAVASFSSSKSSNYGPASVDLFAPGAKIVSTWKWSPSSYATVDGTSMAAPHVAGTLALIFAADPHLTAAQAKAKLLAGVEQRPALIGRSVTGGRLNAARALAAPAPPSDEDGDGVPDAQDSCPRAADSRQADSDGDGLGDVCDPTPLPAPPADLGSAATPTPPPPPPAARLRSVRRVGTVVRGCKRKQRRCKSRRVKVTVALTAPAKLQLVVERRTCKRKRKRCAFAALTRREIPARAGRTSLTIGPTFGSTRLPRGTYRAILRLGAQRATIPFTVR